jgi:hypothetical protein
MASSTRRDLDRKTPWRLGDFQHDRTQYVLRFQEKGGKSREIPVRHDLEGFVPAHVDSAGLTDCFAVGRSETRTLLGEHHRSDHGRETSSLPTTLHSRKPSHGKWFRQTNRRIFNLCILI